MTSSERLKTEQIVSERQRKMNSHYFSSNDLILIFSGQTVQLDIHSAEKRVKFIGKIFEMKTLRTFGVLNCHLSSIQICSSRLDALTGISRISSL